MYYNIKWFDYFYIVKTSCSVYIVVFNDYVFAISPFLILEQVLNVSKVQTWIIFVSLAHRIDVT
jgi:hypothetical protein